VRSARNDAPLSAVDDGNNAYRANVCRKGVGTDNRFVAIRLAAYAKKMEIFSLNLPAERAAPMCKLTTSVAIQDDPLNLILRPIMHYEYAFRLFFS
jgi:hypothetical protein